MHARFCYAFYYVLFRGDTRLHTPFTATWGNVKLPLGAWLNRNAL